MWETLPCVYGEMGPGETSTFGLDLKGEFDVVIGEVCRFGFEFCADLSCPEICFYGVHISIF